MFSSSWFDLFDDNSLDEDDGEVDEIRKLFLWLDPIVILFLLVKFDGLFVWPGNCCTCWCCCCWSGCNCCCCSGTWLYVTRIDLVLSWSITWCKISLLVDDVKPSLVESKNEKIKWL